MPYFTRTRPIPNVLGGYAAIRLLVRKDFDACCAYCLMDELYGGGEENYEIDHFRPKSRFPELKDDFYNLYYACHPCNHIKRDKWPSEALQGRGVYLVDLCKNDFEDHFREIANGAWEGNTTSGSYTIDILRLNRRHLLEVRQLVKELRNRGTRIDAADDED